MSWCHKSRYDIKHLPYSIKILLESVIRQCDGYVITEEHIRSLANWNNGDASETEVPFKPARVILQDFTGVPAIVDLASMRKAMQKANGDTHSSLPIYLCKFYENDFHIILF